MTNTRDSKTERRQAAWVGVLPLALAIPLGFAQAPATPTLEELEKSLQQKKAQSGSQSASTSQHTEKAQEWMCDAPAGSFVSAQITPPSNKVLSIVSGSIEWVASRSDEKWSPAASAFLGSLTDKHVGVRVGLDTPGGSIATVYLIEDSNVTKLGEIPISSFPVAYSLESTTPSEIRVALGGLTSTVRSEFRAHSSQLTCSTGVFRFAKLRTKLGPDE